MTQSQLTFAGATGILKWAGVNSVLQYINYPPQANEYDTFILYIRKDGMYYYFKQRFSNNKTCLGYELIMTSSLDLNGE